MMPSALAAVVMVTIFISACDANEGTRAPEWVVGTYGFTREQEVAILDKHNEYRNLEQASNMNQLTWDSSLAISAQTMADTCTFAHTEGGDFGENIAVATGSSFRVDSFVKKWWAEIKDYTFSTNGCKDGKACGHYTQVVWAKTTSVGCGVSFCDKVTNSMANSTIVFCQYNPPGNYNGEKPFTCTSASGCDYVAPPVVVVKVTPDEACKKRDIAQPATSCHKTDGCNYLYCDDGSRCIGAPDSMAGIPCDEGKICIADNDDVMRCQDDPTDESNDLTAPTPNTPTITVSPSETVNAGTTVTFTSTTTSRGVVTHKFFKNRQLIVGAGPGATYTIPNAQVTAGAKYTSTATIYNAESSSSNEVTLVVKAQTVPTVTLTATPTTEPNLLSMMTFTCTTTSTDKVKYVLSRDGNWKWMPKQKQTWKRKQTFEWQIAAYPKSNGRAFSYSCAVETRDTYYYGTGAVVINVNEDLEEVCEDESSESFIKKKGRKYTCKDAVDRWWDWLCNNKSKRIRRKCCETCSDYNVNLNVK